MKLQQWKVVESSWNDDTVCYVEVGMLHCNDKRSHLKARSSCYAILILDYSAS